VGRVPRAKPRISVSCFVILVWFMACTPLCVSLVTCYVMCLFWYYYCLTILDWVVWLTWLPSPILSSLVPFVACYVYYSGFGFISCPDSVVNILSLDYYRALVHWYHSIPVKWGICLCLESPLSCVPGCSDLYRPWALLSCFGLSCVRRPILWVPLLALLTGIALLAWPMQLCSLPCIAI
jgi:hypothetical protein